MTSYVALYCRISPRPDGSTENVPIQEKWGRAYAARTWPGMPVRVYADPGISAANGDVRPDFDRLRADVAAGEIAHLWTVEQTRLERTELGWFQLAAELDAAGITELHTQRDGVVRVRDEVSGIKAVLAASEVRKLKIRTREKLEELAAQGRPDGAIIPGYAHGQRDEAGRKTLLIIPQQAAAIRLAADWVLAGWSLARIAAKLDSLGHRGARGAKLNGFTVKRMVLNPAVAGLRSYKGAIVGRGIWEPILTEDTWNAVRDKLSEPRLVSRIDGGTYPVDRTRARTSARRYLLTGGCARCGVCGAPMAAALKRLRSETKPYYSCHPNAGGRACVGVLGDPFEAYVAATLLDELDKPEFLAALAVDDREAEREEITTAIRGLDGQRGDLAKMWARRTLTAEEWQAARAELAEQEQELRRQLAEIPVKPPHLEPGVIRAAWDAMVLDERREIVSMFIEKVVVSRAKPGTTRFDSGRVEVVWRRRHTTVP